MRESYDVVVVGGGPAGCYAAKTAAENGVSVLVVEKDPDIGLPVRCAEGVGVAGLQEFVEPDPVFCRQLVTHYHLVAPDGTHVEVAMSAAEGYVLERRIFDRHIAELAAQAGARIVTNTAALGARRTDGCVAVELERGREVVAKVVIGADGVESRVGRWLGLKTACRLHDMETAAQYLVTGIDIVPDRIEMHFGNDVAPCGYFWIFPKGPHTGNLGLAIGGEHAAERSPFYYLDRMMERHWPDASIVGRVAGGIACTGGVKTPVGDNIALVGDAAHQANPITGGGIIDGMKAGRIAGRVVAEAIANGDWSEGGLASYPTEWRESIGRIHRRFYRIKEGVFGLDDDTLDALADVINRQPADKRTIKGILTRALISKPKLLLDLAKIVF